MPSPILCFSPNIHFSPEFTLSLLLFFSFPIFFWQSSLVFPFISLHTSFLSFQIHFSFAFSCFFGPISSLDLLPARNATQSMTLLDSSVYPSICHSLGLSSSQSFCLLPLATCKRDVRLTKFLFAIVHFSQLSLLKPVTDLMSNRKVHARCMKVGQRNYLNPN